MPPAVLPGRGLVGDSLHELVAATTELGKVLPSFSVSLGTVGGGDLDEEVDRETET